MRLTSLNQLILGDRAIVGVWKLTPRHELRYVRRGREEEIVLTGDLVAAEEAGLVIQVQERHADGAAVSRMLTLRGRWEADAMNRLNFLVERRSRQRDRLTFSGGWEIGGSNELLYRFEQIHLKTKKRRTHTLTFRGAWDLDGERRLMYWLDRDSDSGFRFRGSFQTATVLAKEGAIRYQVGVEVQGRRRPQTITLFGRWKLSRKLSLDFEIPYADGLVRPITFGATYSVNPQNAIEARLTTPGGKPLGLEVIFSREFLKDSGEAFVRLKRSLEESAVEGGVRFRW